MARGKMTKAQAFAQFKEINPDRFIGLGGRVDIPARDQAWNDYAEFLCRDGLITRRQCSTWVSPYRD